MKNEEKKNNRARRYITITDESIWETIDVIQNHPDYAKSFNKVINDALYYGLPELEKRLNGSVSLKEPETDKLSQVLTPESDYYFQLVSLMKEIVANQLTLKKLSCSEFNLLGIWADGTRTGESFKKGLLRDTPDFIVKEETRLLREASK